MSGWACPWPSKPGKAPGKRLGVECNPSGNPAYLDPNRVSGVFKEERVLVVRLSRGPGEPRNESCCRTENPVQLLAARLGRQRPREGGAGLHPRGLRWTVGCRAVSDPLGVGRVRYTGSCVRKTGLQAPLAGGLRHLLEGYLWVKWKLHITPPCPRVGTLSLLLWHVAEGS